MIIWWHIFEISSPNSIKLKFLEELYLYHRWFYIKFLHDSCGPSINPCACNTGQTGGSKFVVTPPPRPVVLGLASHFSRADPIHYHWFQVSRRAGRDPHTGGGFLRVRARFCHAIREFQRLFSSRQMANLCLIPPVWTALGQCRANA